MLPPTNDSSASTLDAVAPLLAGVTAAVGPVCVGGLLADGGRPKAAAAGKPVSSLGFEGAGAGVGTPSKSSSSSKPEGSLAEVVGVKVGAVLGRRAMVDVVDNAVELVTGVDEATAAPLVADVGGTPLGSKLDDGNEYELADMGRAGTAETGLGLGLSSASKPMIWVLGQSVKYSRKN